MRKLLFILHITLFLLSQSQVIFAQSDKVWPWYSTGADLEVLIFGDTNLQERENPSGAFVHILPTLKTADLRIGNLEGPLAGTSKDPLLPDIPHKTRWKHSEPEMVQGFVDAGIDAFSVANNVTWPWMALMKSLNVLDAHDIQHAGGGKSIEEAHQPVILEKNGTRVGFLAYACTVFPFQHAATEDVPGIATVRVDTYYKPPRNLDKPGMPPTVVTIPVAQELDRMITDISLLAKETDVIICSYHWGYSKHTEIIDYQSKIAHAAIDAGADVIMGHGNHLIGPIEVYKNRPVFYGLGNLVFDWPKMRTRKNGMLAKLDISDGELRNVSVVPVWRDDDNNPHLLDPNQDKGAELYQLIRERSAGLSAMSLVKKEIVIELK